MKHEGIHFLEELGDQLARCQGERVARRRWGAPARHLRPLALAAVGLAVTGGAVAAVVSSQEDETTGLADATDKVTVAEGTTRSGSPWLLTTGTKPPHADGEPTRFCVSLRVTGERGPETSLICGPITPGTFSGGLAEDAGSETGLVFGTVPDAAVTISVGKSGSFTQSQTLDDDAGIPGRFYVADVGGDLRETQIIFRDDRGHDLHAPESINEFLRRNS
jgi:hypothetical protein